MAVKYPCLSGRSILVVDDEKLLRDAIVYDLKRNNCTVHEAESGQQALEVVKNHVIDLVISDIRMPNGDGLDLLNQLVLRNPNNPVVLLITGFADVTEAEALTRGAYGLLEKPVNRHVLLEKAVAALDHLD